MRGKNALRACGLGMVLAVMAATPNPAFGVSVFAEGTVSTTNGLTDPWDEFKQGSGSPELHLNSTHGPNQAFIGAFGSAGVWAIGSNVQVSASDQMRGPIAVANVFLTITDRLTPPPSLFSGHVLTYTQHLDVQGTTSGSATSPGHFDNSVSILVEQNDETIFDVHETLTSEGGYLATIPRGDLAFQVAVTNGPFDFRVKLAASTGAFAIEDAGAAEADADFNHTFRLGEVTDVFDVTTGQPIAASDFHLYGEDGFDWAHPLAAPEPTTLVLAIVGFIGLAAFGRRRRNR